MEGKKKKGSRRRDGLKVDVAGEIVEVTTLAELLEQRATREQGSRYTANEVLALALRGDRGAARFQLRMAATSLMIPVSDTDTTGLATYRMPPLLAAFIATAFRDIADGGEEPARALLLHRQRGAPRDTDDVWNVTVAAPGVGRVDLPPAVEDSIEVGLRVWEAVNVGTPEKQAVRDVADELNLDERTAKRRWNTFRVAFLPPIEDDDERSDDHASN